MAVFRSSLKQLIINCPRCLFVSRYSIYKVHLFSPPALADSQIILSQILPFVKCFFQVFSNFFPALFKPFSDAPRSLSRALWVLPVLNGRFVSQCLSASDFRILYHGLANVKHFFQIFSLFFRIFFLPLFSSLPFQKSPPRRAAIS